ncbi:MAG: aminopeptidase N [Aestuariivirga sp.]|nr:aminopeptidase N [Aestuariivirga sp.]
MAQDAPTTIHLKDYKPAPYVPGDLHLTFSLEPRATRVISRMDIKPNPASPDKNAALVLSGEKLKLIGLKLDGKKLEAPAFLLTERDLTIPAPPASPFTLEIETECDPVGNTALSGLYQSNGVFCTQCEAEGFRRITYFYDRPDVMTRYTVRVEANKASCPILLSNGNFQEGGDIAGTDRHFAVWHDPHPKPSYLFALVAGDLAGVRDSFTTMSGKAVQLSIYVEKGKEDRCAWAMESLKASMRWDEEAFGREYDLDVFNIVAVSDFNMGAMENKGLNVFNDKYILALPETATDLDYTNIEAIIAHEYFHNWTGNRITCRDWFQLCLKEGLTVFRDQEFSSDLRSRAVKRITDVKTLRARQMPEDAGPLAHPPRPNAYIEINNFYTPTVYEKGAEICRMMKTLIGDKAFRKAMDLYFERHDGEAATVEDFVACMADTSGRDLTQFFKWYEQAGTPQVKVTTHYDAKAKTFDLTLAQTTAPTPGQSDKQPMHIPFGLGLVEPSGEDMTLDLEGVGSLNAPIIELTEEKRSFRFRNIVMRPVLSLNRGFSAPVILQEDVSPEDQLFLMGRDRDTFNRWEAGQSLGKKLIIASLKPPNDLADVMGDIGGYAAALKTTLGDQKLDQAFKALMLGLPTEADIAAALAANVDTDQVLKAREFVRGQLGGRLRDTLLGIWNDTRESGKYEPNPESTGRRSLRYAVLGLLAAGMPDMTIDLIQRELASASSMTAEIGALTAMLSIDAPETQQELDKFYARHKGDSLLVDKWFALNSYAADAAKIETLMGHPDFRLSTPNRVYALIGGFTAMNLSAFHAADGEGYRVVADTILKVNAINPQVAARMATGFRSWRIMDEVRRQAAAGQLERILASPGLSRDCIEIVSKTLKG